ncbi:MAG: tRNA-dihydrouridine synthase family protein [Fimbriimonadaceae bacterium]
MPRCATVRVLLDPRIPALVLAPMDGVTDAAMRDFQGASGAFTYAVTEFLRVSSESIPRKVFRREVPELETGGKTSTGMPVQVQILGGDPGRMATSAYTAWQVGAKAIDINFGCPAPTVNRHDGGASLLRHPCRIREIVRAVRDAVPNEIPVSAKLRLGWDSIEPIYENAQMAVDGGATWITVHARTRVQGYSPPVYWEPLRQVRSLVDVPVIANGDIWSLNDFHRCLDETGCQHFMIGRGALADPMLPHMIGRELGISSAGIPSVDWATEFCRLVKFIEKHEGGTSGKSLLRLKQWIKIAHSFGDFERFHELKVAQSLDEFFDVLARFRP